VRWGGGLEIGRDQSYLLKTMMTLARILRILWEKIEHI